MIDIISELFNIGDNIKIHCSDGTYEGKILVLKPGALAIKSKDGVVRGIKDDTISSFEAIEPQSTIDNQIQLKQEETIASESQMVDSNSSKLEDNPIESSADVKDGDIFVTASKDVDQSQYKAGDKIPLEILHEIDPELSTKKHFPKSKTKLKTLGTGLDSLSVLVDEDHEVENQKIVPAIGEIKALRRDRNFGFITDSKTRKDVWFSFNQVVDADLQKNLFRYTPVIYTIQQGEQGPIAISIHKPGKIKDLLLLAQSLYDIDNYKGSLNVLNHILSEYPSNFSAAKLKSTISQNVPSYIIKVKGFNKYYDQAKKYHGNKNYEKAIEYYQKAIDSGERVESAIKDLGMLYSALQKQTTSDNEKERYRKCAYDLMTKHVSDLPDNISSWYYLENFYYSINAYEEFDRVINKILEDPDIAGDKKKWTTFMSKKAAAFLRQGMSDKSLEIIDNILGVDPMNTSALKLKSLIESPAYEGDYELLISATSFDTFTSGLSPYIERILEEYNEYAGVPPKILASGNFDATTLKGVRSLIDSFRGRARERAKLLLTEAKLMMSLEPENVDKFRSVMARYCNDMAKNHISFNNSMEITRFFYNEAFSLEESWDKTHRQVAYYLLTHCMSNTELLTATTEYYSIDNALDMSISNVYDQKLWDSILSMLLYNRDISAQITSKLFSNKNLKYQAIMALKSFGSKMLNSDNKDEFVDAWNEARENRLIEFKKKLASIKALLEYPSIEAIIHPLYELKGVRNDWLGTLDSVRISNISNNIAPSIDNYIKSSGYRNKETSYNDSFGQIQQMIEEITDGPTKLSYEAILPLMEHVMTLLKDSFDDVVQMSEPKLDIKLLSSETVVDDNNVVALQINVENHKDSSPVREVSVDVLDSLDVKCIGGDITYNAIEGGDSCIFKVKVKVSDNVLASKATAVVARCKYKSGSEQKEYQSQLSLKLYSPNEFAPINNPYAPFADGGPVSLDSNMFYGRKEFIANVVESIIKSPSKQVIIYGQKRCGKSSVLLHLRKRLIDTGKTFCISFSLGDIVQNLTEASFYYKILSSIKEELEMMEFDGQTVPQFSIPRLSEFKEEDTDNPLNSFSRYMTQFKRSCKNTEGWEDKNLVVMIDEFTYLYTEIKRDRISPSIMKQWKAITQNEKCQFSVVLVGQDVVPSFKKEDYARNAFGVIQDIRLTYLQEEPARELIERPISDDTGKSRYVGNAVSRIIDYTSRNPYYIQIFCARLVDYMNANKSISVTEADVNDVAKSFIIGDQALEEDKFDNLIRAGESEDLQEYPEADILKVLHEVALGSKNIGFCGRTDIDAIADKKLEDDILKHLVDREVLEKKGDNNYKIQVKLFQEWLLNH